MLENGIDMASRPGGVHHYKGCGLEGYRIIIHEGPIVPKREQEKRRRIRNFNITRTYKSLMLLRIAEEDILGLFVCQFFRDLTRVSMSVLIVG
jgi:hypothetical protein